MGCEQSAVNKASSPKWSAQAMPPISHIDTETQRQYNNSYQDVCNRQANHGNHGIIDFAKADELLQQYVTSTEKISFLEKGDPITAFYIKTSHVGKIEEAIKAQLEAIEFILNRQIEFEQQQISSGERSDKKTVKGVILEMGDRKNNPQDQEILAGMNKLEIAMTELEMFHQEKAMTESDLDDLQSILIDLSDQYQIKDDALEQLSLKNLSHEENRLQEQLANFERKRIKLTDVYERWKEGRALVGEACRQLSLAVEKWKKVKDDSPMNLYFQGEEIRDDLVTALQCLTNSKFYIETNFPYCSKTEMSIMEKAMAYLFIDMKSDQRRLHAEGCYTAFQKRAVALYAWIDMTMHAVLAPDLKKRTNEINEKIQKLSEIRKMFFESRFPGVSWKEPNVLPGMELTPTYSLSDSESEKIFNELDIGQLAPLPSREEIFGSMRDSNLVVDNYKSRLRDSVSKHVNRNKYVQENMEKIINRRRNSSLVQQNSLIAEDTVFVQLHQE